MSWIYQSTTSGSGDRSLWIGKSRESLVITYLAVYYDIELCLIYQSQDRNRVFSKNSVSYSFSDYFILNNKIVNMTETHRAIVLPRIASSARYNLSMRPSMESNLCSILFFISRISVSMRSKIVSILTNRSSCCSNCCTCCSAMVVSFDSCWLFWLRIP